MAQQRVGGRHLGFSRRQWSQERFDPGGGDKASHGDQNRHAASQAPAASAECSEGEQRQQSHQRNQTVTSKENELFGGVCDRNVDRRQRRRRDERPNQRTGQEQTLFAVALMADQV